MYKLLIVDDEETIREGLSKIVNWKSLGYEIVQAVEDGQDAVGYMEKSPVDIILTDIKMTFMSGLELAKYVHENKPTVRVVIISGFKEFEFARQALCYNVKHYLLKPTRLDELKRVFSELKEEMDKEILEKEKIKNEKQVHQELLYLTQEQFFTDLILGAIRTKETVDKRIRSICLGINPSISKICVMNLCFSSDDNEYVDQAIGKDTLYTTLRNYIGSGSGDIRYFTIFNSSEHIQIVAISDLQIDNSELEESTMKFFEIISAKIKAILGICIKTSIERTFNSFYEAAIYYEPLIPSVYADSYKLEDVIDSCDMSRLTKQKKLFFSYINSNNEEAGHNLFENFMDELKYMNKVIVHNFIIDLFANLKSELGEFGVDMSNNLFNYEVILKLYDVNEIKLWGRSLITNLIKHVKCQKDTSENNFIQKAKEYINDNFDKDIGLDEVADKVVLSSIYFSRLFKQLTGENFVDYLMKVRIRKAMELLQNERYKIYEVSVNVGYKNTKYFYKLFKEYTGVTPAEYRQNALKEGRRNE
jgi:two-component system, response regulator YesN